MFEIEPQLSFPYPYLPWDTTLKKGSILYEIRSDFWCEKFESWGVKS